jgi:hypothetical protein
VPRGAAPCPPHALVTGQSGTGKSWALAQVAKFWVQCTSPAHVFSTDQFEEAVENGAPLPTDPHVLLALDDVDSLGNKALAVLRTLVSRRPPRGARLLLALCDAYREPRHRFLAAVALKVPLYRTTYPGPLRQFVKAQNLVPVPPDAFVAKAVARSGGNLHRLLHMLKAHRREQTLTTGADDRNMWQEERLFRTGQLDTAPSEKCTLMVCFNSYDNAAQDDGEVIFPSTGSLPSTGSKLATRAHGGHGSRDSHEDLGSCASLASLAQLHERHSAALVSRDPWLFYVADLPLPGQHHDVPTLYFQLTSKLAHLKRFLPLMTRFFRAWGCDSSGLPSVEERVDVFRAHWIAHEQRLRRDQAETARLFAITGTDAAFLRTLDEMMSARRGALAVRLRLGTRKFLLG